MREKALAPLLNNRRWSRNDHPATVLGWLLDQYRSILPDNLFFEITGDGQNHFIANYQVQDFDDGYYLLPLAFLPELAKNDPALHGILLMTFALMYSKFVLNDWDGHAERFVEICGEYFDENGDPYNDEIDVDFYTSNIKFWTEGPPAHYHNLLIEIGQTATIAGLQEALRSYELQSNFKNTPWLPWVKKVLDLLTTGFSLRNFYIPPETESCLFQDAITIWWGFDDPLFDFYHESINDEVGNFGIFPPVIVQELRADNNETIASFPYDNHLPTLLSLIIEADDIYGGLGS